jgi:predicted transposase YdaD
MVKKADISTKKLISLAPENWVKWVTQIPDITTTVKKSSKEHFNCQYF